MEYEGWGACGGLDLRLKRKTAAVVLRIKPSRRSRRRFARRVTLSASRPSAGPRRPQRTKRQPLTRPGRLRLKGRRRPGPVPKAPLPPGRVLRRHRPHPRHPAPTSCSRRGTAPDRGRGHFPVPSGVVRHPSQPPRGRRGSRTGRRSQRRNRPCPRPRPRCRAQPRVDAQLHQDRPPLVSSRRVVPGHAHSPS